MASAFKCDICGTLFQKSQCAMEITNTDKANLMVVQFKKSHTKLDVCTPCLIKYIKDLLGGFELKELEISGENTTEKGI